MAPDEASARQKALNFYRIEPTLLRLMAIKADSANTKPRDHPRSQPIPKVIYQA
jgi:hypothetical protein